MTYNVLARIANGLGVPNGYLGLAYDEETRVRVVATVGDPSSGDKEALKRQKFLARAAALTMGAIVYGSDTVTAPASDVPANNELMLLDPRQLEATMKALHVLKVQYSNEASQDALSILAAATRLERNLRPSS
jgi:hypothetical protein